MLRFYRFIFIRSRSLTLLKQHVVERSSLNVQSFRLSSYCFHVAQKSQVARDDVRYNHSLTFVMEDENEKFIYNFTNSEDCFGLSAQNPVSEHVFVETDVSKLQRWFSNNQRLPDEFDKNYEVYDNIIEIESSFKWMNIKDIHQTIRRLVTSSKTAEDIDEVISLLLDFYNQQPYAFMNQNLLFEFIKRSCQISKPEKPVDGQMYGAKKTLEVIIQIQKLFPPGARHFSRSQLLPFFESLFNHKDTDFISALRVCHELIDIDLVPDRKVFLEVAAKYLIEKLPYDEAFYKWSNACSMDNIVSGGNIFLEYVLSDKKIAIKLQEKRINQLVKLYEQVLTPNDLIAQLIVSLVSTGRLADAKVLWLKLDVHCKHFLSPLHNLGSDKFVDVDLVHIRDFAHLFEKCVLAEFKSKKRLKKKKVVASGEESSEDLPDGEETVKLEPIPDGDMAFLIKRWQPYKKRKYGKPQKIKKFEVKADQLEALVNTIQEVWFRLIKLKNDPKVVGVEELEQFLKRNNIPFSEKIHERVQKFKEMQKNLEC